MLAALLRQLMAYTKLPKYPEIIVQDYSPNCLRFPFFAGHLCEVAHGLAVMW